MASTTSPVINQTGPGIYYHSKAATIASVVALCTVMLVAIVGNLGIILIFRSFKHVRKQVANHFLINLAISDLIVALVTMPFWVIYEIDRWESLPQSWNRLHFELAWNFIDIVCEATSIASLAIVSIDRLYSVTNPFRHRTKVTPSVAHKIVLGTWTYAALTGSIFFLKTRWMSAIITVVAFVIPQVIMIVCYTKIVFAVRGCRRRWAKNPSGDQQLFGRVVNEYKTAKNLSIIIVAFVVCWTPFFVCSLILHYCGMKCVPELQQRYAMSTSSKWLHYSNSAINPILYTFFNPTYRVVFSRFYAQFLRKPRYRCPTGYDSWYVRKRCVSSVTSQRSASRTGSLTIGTRVSDTSSQRASISSMAANERNQIVPKQHLDIINDEVFDAEVLANVGANTTSTDEKNEARAVGTDSRDTIL